ncbi:MAG: ABC transporter ATP-binding protein, partial [Rhodospirillales bacterium]|nr:ABC transporter ATP-binding protein [Rhodospirillales bacterium]
MTGWASLRAVLRLFRQDRRLLLGGGAALSAATVLAGVALLGLSGWFITATAIAGLSSAAALVFDVFQPSAGIRFLAILRTAARYGERLVTHDAALAVLAALRERLFRAYAAPNAARALLARPARLLFRLTADVDALDTLYLRLLVPAAAALATAAAVGIGLGLLD